MEYKEVLISDLKSLLVKRKLDKNKKIFFITTFFNWKTEKK
jgi:hypothetical protein